MPKLSLYRPVKSNDYRFFDKTIYQQFTVGGTDLYIHKYLGPTPQGPSNDFTQPQYDILSPTNIQDLLFLENRDRTYDSSIIRLRGHYNVQNLDFDLSQFGLFLNNDIIFITIHYNNMIDLVGRKLIVGDVLELPHLLDYNPLDETIPVALRRFYQITDGNFASEGFSQTWYPHLWRIKCEPLVNSEEFSQILNEPINQDNFLGLWDKDKPYPEGYVITYGGTNYISKKPVPPGVNPPDPEYWEVDTNRNLADIISTYNKNIAINNAALEEAKRILPLSGYDNQNLYVVPTYGVGSGKLDQPAPPTNLVAPFGAPAVGRIAMINTPGYTKPSPVIRIPKAAAKSIWDMTVDADITSIADYSTLTLESLVLPVTVTDTGSGAVSGTGVVAIRSMGIITGPYGTADNTYATADQNPELPGFTDTIEPWMDFRADCDPRFQFIARSTPRSFGYSTGYLTGTQAAPNGVPTGVGISFPQNPKIGDYFLRIDYLPQILYRWNGDLWIRISSNVRTGTGFTDEDKSLRSSFINNSNTFMSTSGTVIPEKQNLSTILTIAPDDLPPRP
jgi:hypothetical protein